MLSPSTSDLKKKWFKTNNQTCDDHLNLRHPELGNWENIRYKLTKGEQASYTIFTKIVWSD